MVIDSRRNWLGIQCVKVTLYFHLREKIAKRLHHGLSNTILVNTLTDVREFKNQLVNCGKKQRYITTNEITFAQICPNCLKSTN